MRRIKDFVGREHTTTFAGYVAIVHHRSFRNGCSNRRRHAPHPEHVHPARWSPTSDGIICSLLLDCNSKFDRRRDPQTTERRSDQVRPVPTAQCRALRRMHRSPFKLLSLLPRTRSSDSATWSFAGPVPRAHIRPLRWHAGCRRVHRRWRCRTGPSEQRRCGSRPDQSHVRAVAGIRTQAAQPAGRLTTVNRGRGLWTEHYRGRLARIISASLARSTFQQRDDSFCCTIAERFGPRQHRFFPPIKRLDRSGSLHSTHAITAASRVPSPRG